MTEPLALLCVDDQRTFREALQLALAADDRGDLQCVATAESVAEALDCLEGATVDVVLIDYELPDMHGIEGTRLIKSRHPDVRVLVLTAHTDLDLFLRAVAAGADGFLDKNAPLHELFALIRSDTRGLTLDEATLQSLRGRVGNEGLLSGRSWHPDLTRREKEVLALLAAGVDQTNIAKQLGVTVHTSRSYVRDLLTKLGAHSQLEAVAVAQRAGLLSDERDRTAPSPGESAEDVGLEGPLGSPEQT